MIIDLVVNHTSDQHPWFQSARSSPDSPYRDWYVWSETAPSDRHQGMVFPGEQAETWSYDRTAKLWYYHRFYKFQPDLNITNPEVRDGDQEDLRVLAAARRLRVPDGRGAVHHRGDRAGQPGLAQGHGVPHRAAPARAVAPGRRGAAGRGQCRARAAAELLRRRGRLGQPDPHAVRLHAQRPADARPRPGQPGSDHRRAAGHPDSCRPAASGPPSCATTTRSTCPGSPPSSATRCSPSSARTRTCSCTAGASAAGWPRCSATTAGASSWPTRCSSACAAPRCCGTARRSAWATTSPWTGATRSVPRCSGPCCPTAASPPPPADQLVRPVITDGEYGYQHGQRHLPAARPDVAAVLVRADDPHPAGGARGRQRHLHPRRRARAARVCWCTGPTTPPAPCSSCTTSARRGRHRRPRAACIPRPSFPNDVLADQEYAGARQARRPDGRGLRLPLDPAAPQAVTEYGTDRRRSAW